MKIVFIDYSPKYLPELVEIHRDAFKDHFNSRLGNYYTRNFLCWFVKKDKYKKIFFLGVDESSGELLGYICGAEENYHKKLNIDLLFVTFISFLIHPYLFLDNRFWQMFSVKVKAILGIKDKSIASNNNNIQKPIFDFIGFALSPKYRNMGFGYFLLDKFVDQFNLLVKQLGGKTINSTIYAHNKLIHHYFKSKNWIPVRKSENSKFINFYKEL